MVASSALTLFATRGRLLLRCRCWLERPEEKRPVRPAASKLGQLHDMMPPGGRSAQIAGFTKLQGMPWNDWTVDGDSLPHVAELRV